MTLEKSRKVNGASGTGVISKKIPGIPGALLLFHLVLYLIGTRQGWFHPLEPFTLVLFVFNLATAVYLTRHPDGLLFGSGMMFLVAVHTVMGPLMAPDQLTSGAVLFVNILVLYTGVRINLHLPSGYWYLFVAGYLVLFAIFVLALPNAESLFLLFLLGLAATARSYRLTAFFWAVTLSFTFFQPYAWAAVVLCVMVINAVFGARGHWRSTATVMFLLCGFVLVALVLLPVLIMLLGESPRNIFRVLGEARVRDALWTTVITATVATLILAAFMTPFAYALSRLRFPGRTVLLSLMDLPVVIPQSVAGIALVIVFGRQQALGELFYRYLGLRFDGTIFGIILAQIFVGLPFMIRSAMAAFDAVPPTLESQARTLGAPPFAAFRRVALPLASRGVFLGAVLAWARAAGEFGAVLFIAPTPETAPVAAYNRFFSVGIFEAAPLVATLLAFSIVMFFILQLVSRLFTNVRGESETAHE